MPTPTTYAPGKFSTSTRPVLRTPTHRAGVLGAGVLGCWSAGVLGGWSTARAGSCDSRDHGIESRETRGVIKGLADLFDQAANSLQVNALQVECEQTLDVGAIAVTPSRRLVHDQILRSRHTDPDIVEVDLLRLPERVLFERKPGECDFDGNAGRLMPQKQNLPFLSKGDRIVDPRDDALLFQDAHDRVEVRSTAENGGIDIDRLPRNTGSNDGYAPDDHGWSWDSLQGCGNRSKRAAKAIVSGHRAIGDEA